MNCHEASKRLCRRRDLFVDADVQAHCEQCTECAAVAVSQHGVDRALALIEKTSTPIGLEDRAFRAAMKGRSKLYVPTFWERLLPLVTPVAASVAVAAVLVLLFVRPAPQGEREGVSSLKGAGEFDDTGIFDSSADDRELESALVNDLFAIEEQGDAQ